MRLLAMDGRTEVDEGTECSPGEAMPRSTVIPDKTQPLNQRVLGAILSVKQTGLGRSGLEALIAGYGLD